jgi:hypothetical protein
MRVDGDVQYARLNLIIGGTVRCHCGSFQAGDERATHRFIYYVLPVYLLAAAASERTPFLVSLLPPNKETHDIQDATTYVLETIPSKQH